MIFRDHDIGLSLGGGCRPDLSRLQLPSLQQENTAQSVILIVPDFWGLDGDHKYHWFHNAQTRVAHVVHALITIPVHTRDRYRSMILTLNWRETWRESLVKMRKFRKLRKLRKSTHLVDKAVYMLPLGRQPSFKFFFKRRGLIFRYLLPFPSLLPSLPLPPPPYSMCCPHFSTNGDPVLYGWIFHPTGQLLYFSHELCLTYQTRCFFKVKFCLLPMQPKQLHKRTAPNWL